MDVWLNNRYVISYLVMYVKIRYVYITYKNLTFLFEGLKDEEISPQSTGFVMTGDFLLFCLMFRLHVLKSSGKSCAILMYLCMCVYMH